MKEFIYSNENEKIYLSSSEEYNISLDRVLEVELTVLEHVKAVLLLNINNCEKININLTLKEGSSLRIIHKCESEIELNEKGNLYRDSNLYTGFYLLDDKKTDVNVTYYLKDSGADVNVLTSLISSNENKYFIECVHEVPHTSSMIENYAIVKESANYTIVASGKINKGAYGSKSHQSTRVLTMQDKQNASVTPLLLIDENDVEASHACALGSMNEDHLYYLQTRGLNKTQALGLLTLSYVLPLLRIIEETSFNDVILKEIESKVGLSC